MTPTTSTGPFETVAVWTLATVAVLVGMVWGSGIVVGSILGSTLPTGGDGIKAILANLPDVGSAWTPPIPTPLVTVTAIAVAAATAPLIWRLAAGLRSNSRGAEWATTRSLQAAGLLVSDRPVPGAHPEPGSTDE